MAGVNAGDWVGRGSQAVAHFCLLLLSLGGGKEGAKLAQGAGYGAEKKGAKVGRYRGWAKWRHGG